MKTVLAVDGNSIINRAYFGVRPLTNGKGQRTEAIYGMLHIVTSACERVNADSVLAAFDLHAPTFRHRMYDGYKSGRKGMEEELRAQLQPAKDLLTALGYKVLSLEGYEADDILGTIAAKAEEEGDRCYILTGDRDSLQLISDTTNVLLAGKETVLYDRAAFKEKYGISPEQFVDAKALMGDSSDNIPGVPGVGEKTALPLIAQFGSLDGVYEHLDDPSIKGGVRLKLENFKESAYLSQKLARICRSVPIELDFSPAVRAPELGEMLADLGFSTYISKWGLNKSEQAAKADEVAYKDLPAAELCARKGPAAVLFEGDDLLLTNEEGSFRVSSPDAFTLTEFFAPGRDVTVSDSKSFYAGLDARGIDDFEVSDDLSLAAYVLSSTDGDYTLPGLCLRYLSESIEKENTDAVYRLRPVLLDRLKKEGSYKLYKEVELPLSKVLFNCEKTGVLIDAEGVEAFGEKLKDETEKKEKEIYALAGREFNIQSPKQLGAVLFDEMGLIVPGLKKTKSGYSTSAETLEQLRYEPIVREVLDYRQLSKLRSTYTEGLLKVADEHRRVHTKFTQTVTATGRLSSVEPNLQNIPVRTELGRELRRFFIAPEGRVLIDADYSQIELRLLAAVAGDERLIGAFKKGADVHAITASEVFHVPLEDVTPELRKRAKAVNFGIVYGISAFSLAGDLGIPRYEADNYIKRYFATYPAVEAYLRESVASAQKDGYVTTLFGRRRYIPELTSGKGALKKFGERVAMNSPIQGTAADVIKIAMVAVDRALKKEAPDARLILQVHDELIVEAAEKDAAKAAEILRREMEGAAELPVPLTVELNVGKSWYDCK